MNVVDWAQFVATAVGGAFGLFCLFDGTRRAAGGNPDGRGGRLLAIGLLIVGLLAGNAYWQHWNYLEASKAYRAGETPRELPADFGKKMSPSKREASSQNAARSAYIATGTIRQYIDVSGQRKPFSPAPDDIKRRDKVVATDARLERKAEESFQEFILWLVLGLSALVFGVGFALEPAAKPPEEADARVEPIMPPAPAPVRAPVPPPAAAVASAAAVAPPAAAAPKPKPSVGIDTVPLPKPRVGGDTVPLAKLALEEEEHTLPLPKPSSVGSDTIPLPKPGIVPPKKT